MIYPNPIDLGRLIDEIRWDDSDHNAQDILTFVLSGEITVNEAWNRLADLREGIA